MLRFIALSAAAANLCSATTDPLGCDSMDKAMCKSTDGCKWSGSVEICWNKQLGNKPTEPRPSSSPSPSPRPTGAPTATPTLAPTQTDAPTPSPTMATLGDGEACGDIAVRSDCLATMTCAYKQKEQVCVGCEGIESRNTCDGTSGCRWRQQQCSLYAEDPHPNDDVCRVHMTKRNCRQAEGCLWNRNGKCRGLSSCADQKNNISCRAAYNCYWMPRTNACVNLETVSPDTDSTRD